MDYLIRKKATGNQKELARKLGMSRSMVNEYIKEMKELGFPIGYCRKRNTYYYLEEGYMVERLFHLGNEKERAAAVD
jgi:biotin operon repressor